MKKIKKLFLALLAVLMTFSLTACGNDGKEPSDSGSTATETSYQTTFTYAVGGEPTYLDPAVASDSVTAYILNQIYFPLFYIGEDGSLVNAACTEYSVSEDGLVYTFKLSENNYWSDGQQVTAADYVYGMKHAVNLGSAESTYSFFITDNVLNADICENKPTAEMDSLGLGIKAVDDFTIEITLKKVMPYFTALLPAGVFYPVREEFVKDGDMTWADDTTVPTNGPFHPTSIDRASEVVMERNEYFVNESDKEIVVEKMVAKSMEDMDAQLMAFQTGEIDFATSVDATTVYNMYHGQPEYEAIDSVLNYFVNINSSDVGGANEALKDVNVRKALNYAIDRSQITTALDAGDVYTPLYGLVPPGFAGNNGDFREEGGDLVGYDLELAKQLLAEAGYDESNPLQLTYYYNQSTMHDTVAAVLKSELAKANVELTLKTGEIRTFFDDRTNGLFELARNAMSADYMDPRTFLDMALSSYQATPTWGDSTYDQMIEDTNALEGAERIDALHDAEAYLVGEQYYTIPLFSYKNVCLKKAGTTGQLGSPQANYIFWYVHVPE